MDTWRPLSARIRRLMSPEVRLLAGRLAGWLASGGKCLFVANANAGRVMHLD